MKKVFIGYSQAEKDAQIKELVAKEKITNIVYFSKDGDKGIEIPGCETECRSWGDAILYKYFYPLLDKINNDYLLVFDDMMRTQKRNDLTYNCCHHYVNQTENVLVFEAFPMIEAPEDFMILIDMIFPNRFKGQNVINDFIGSQYVDIKPYQIEIHSIPVVVTAEAQQEYEELRDSLFEEAESGKDPNTIPRELHVWAGTRCKKQYIGDGYIARNKRFKGVKTYKDKVDAEAVTIIDFPVKQIQFNDFVKNNDIHKIHFLNTELSVDKMYFGQIESWIETMNEVFYAQASI